MKDRQVPTEIETDLVAKIFRDALDLPDDFELEDSMAFEEVPGWDSLGHMRIVLQMEDLVGTGFDLDDIVGLDTVGKIREFFASKSG